MMKYGVENSNYRHGGYSANPDCGEVKQALAKDLLRRILTTPCDYRGELPFTPEEQRWAMEICRKWVSGEDRPQWCRDVMRNCGFEDKP